MRLSGFVWHGAVLGLMGAVTGVPNPVEECSDGVTILELQPYEIICDGPHGPVTSMSTSTRTITGAPRPTNGVKFHAAQDSDEVAPEGSNYCTKCAMITTEVETPFCETIPPATDGGVTTIITGVVRCDACATVTTTGPVPFRSTMTPDSSEGVTTVLICEGLSANPEFATTTVTTTISGAIPGTTTVSPAPGCTTGCTGTVRVTAIDSSLGADLDAAPSSAAVSGRRRTRSRSTDASVATDSPERPRKGHKWASSDEDADAEVLVTTNKHGKTYTIASPTDSLATATRRPGKGHKRPEEDDDEREKGSKKGHKQPGSMKSHKGLKSEKASQSLEDLELLEAFNPLNPESLDALEDLDPLEPLDALQVWVDIEYLKTMKELESLNYLDTLGAIEALEGDKEDGTKGPAPTRFEEFVLARLRARLAELFGLPSTSAGPIITTITSVGVITTDVPIVTAITSDDVEITTTVSIPTIITTDVEITTTVSVPTVITTDVEVTTTVSVPTIITSDDVEITTTVPIVTVITSDIEITTTVPVVTVITNDDVETTTDVPTTGDVSSETEASGTAGEGSETTLPPSSTDEPPAPTMPSTAEVPSSSVVPTTTVPFEQCPTGLEWAYYQMERSDSDEETFPGQIPISGDGALWANDYFDVQEVLSGQTATGFGRTSTIGIGQACGSDSREIYERDFEDGAEYMVLQHIGYFHPATTGTFTFTFNDVDEAIYAWTGPNAISGFNNANADVVVYFQSARPRFFTVTAEAGDYIPIRILFVNAQECGAFSLRVTDAEGNVIVSDVTPVVGDQLVTGCATNPDAPAFDFEPSEISVS